MSVASFMPIAEANPASYPMYSWGNNADDRLGRIVDEENPANRPGRVQGEWISIATAAGGSFAISTDGELFAWGNVWSSANMGQGGTNPNVSSGTPMRIGTASNWTVVTAAGSNVAAINSAGELFRWGTGGTQLPELNIPTRIGATSNWVDVSLGVNTLVALSDQGEIWGMGAASHGTSATVAVFSRVGTRSDWTQLSAVGTGTNFHTLAISESGHVYSWGNNGGGGTGQGFTNGWTTSPTRVGTETNWVEIRAGLRGAAAINSDGELWTWGADLGRPTDIVPAHTPGRVGTASNWISLHGGASHYFAFNSLNELWGWGLNTSGQLGDGTTTTRTEPVFILQTYGFAAAARGGGSHSMLLMRTTPAEGDLDLVKELQKPEGTPIPNLNFTFTITRNAFNGDTAQANTIPRIGSATDNPNVGQVVIPINSSSDIDIDGGVVTLTNTADILGGVSFNRAGIFSYIVRETVNSSGTNAANNLSTVVYSQAEYELRVYVERDFSRPGEVFVIDATTLHLRVDDQGQSLTDEKVYDFTFTNIYTRTTTGPNDYDSALAISKVVTGDVPPLNTVFNFQVTLTRTALCPENRTFIGQVYNANDTPSGSPITFTTGATTVVQMTHGQRLVFDELVIGTRFTVTELAAPAFTASVEARANGVAINIAPNTEPNQSLSIGGPHIVGDNENFVVFTNLHFFAYPTGIVVNNALIAIPVIAVLGLALLLAGKHRKHIEEMPLI